ncbi:hypothetical protein FA13DRAFT_1770800 [Coprinellus micaceus]|uniref:Uncharacterized protein n=1 Tax=Coprinellus micaceus TaxID=71717 RepID=A0A4Y7TTC1_COPMI|nr:hypothetical protein FA13DRAFT_1770800 [Coprinellus micaceus]
MHLLLCKAAAEALLKSWGQQSLPLTLCPAKSLQRGTVTPGPGHWTTPSDGLREDVKGISKIKVDGSLNIAPCQIDSGPASLDKSHATGQPWAYWNHDYSYSTTEMSAGDEPAPGVVGVATSGIQDVSALLPLLGTDQCERLVTSALQHGLLYAAAAPMSIFGSLGIVKAGFVVLWSCIDHRPFSGPKGVRNAGFVSSGIGELLAPVADNRQLYVAEDRIRENLSKVKIKSVDVNLFSKDQVLWNFCLVGTTFLLSGLGLLPYVYVIERSLPDASFRSTWLYPILRTIGCGLVVISIQVIFQLRILEEVYHRLRFIATDNCLKGCGKSLPSDWDPNLRSKDALEILKKEHGEYSELVLAKDIGKIASFKVEPLSGKLLPPELPTKYTHAGGPSDEEKGGTYSPFQARVYPKYTLHFILLSARVVLLFGLVISVIGYIGCFSVVQSAPKSDSKASIIWLSVESFLAVARVFLWALNPGSDDAGSPIVLKKEREERDVDKKKKPTYTGGSKTAPQVVSNHGSSYRVGWTLESLTANDVYALVVGVKRDEQKEGLVEDIKSKEGQVGEDKSKESKAKEGNEAKSNAVNMTRFLKHTLLVPGSQITTLQNVDATKSKIVEALKALPRAAEKDAPILIYFSTDSEVNNEKETNLLLWPDSGKPGDSSISYKEILDLLGHIAQEKTENITLILECPHAARMEANGKSESNAFCDSPVGARPELQKVTEEFIGYSSHILLAGAGPGGGKNNPLNAGGDFTQSLLNVLESKDYAKELPTMTYKRLVELLNQDMKSLQPKDVRDPEQIRVKVPRQRDLESSLPNGQEGPKSETSKPGWHTVLSAWRAGRIWAGRRQRHKRPAPGNSAAFCTTLYQNRRLLNGLFSRRIIDDNATPAITVTYSDR